MLEDPLEVDSDDSSGTILEEQVLVEPHAEDEEPPPPRLERETRSYTSKANLVDIDDLNAIYETKAMLGDGNCGFRCARSWNFLNGFSNDPSLFAANQDITDYRRHLYRHLSDSLQHVLRPFKDSAGDTLPDFTGSRRAVLLRVGRKIWRRNVNYDRDGADEEDWYDVMATTPVISHMERRTVFVYDKEWNRTVIAVYDYDHSRDVSVLHLVEGR
jgi:hypothetical protein